MARRRRDPDAPSLSIDDEGMVILCDPSKEGEAGEFTRLGHVLDGDLTDGCPASLWSDLAWHRGDYIDRLGESGDGRRQLRRLHREGSLR